MVLQDSLWERFKQYENCSNVVRTHVSDVYQVTCRPSEYRDRVAEKKEKNIDRLHRKLFSVPAHQHLFSSFRMIAPGHSSVHLPGSTTTIPQHGNRAAQPMSSSVARMRNIIVTSWGNVTRSIKSAPTPASQGHQSLFIAPVQTSVPRLLLSAASTPRMIALRTCMAVRSALCTTCTSTHKKEKNGTTKTS